MQLSAVEVRHDARLQSFPGVQHQRAHGGRQGGVLGTLPGAPHGLHALPGGVRQSGMRMVEQAM
jgi:hypothetical protein